METLDRLLANDYTILQFGMNTSTSTLISQIASLKVERDGLIEVLDTIEDEMLEYLTDIPGDCDLVYWNIGMGFGKSTANTSAPAGFDGNVSAWQGYIFDVIDVTPLYATADVYPSLTISNGFYCDGDRTNLFPISATDVLGPTPYGEINSAAWPTSIGVLLVDCGPDGIKQVYTDGVTIEHNLVTTVTVSADDILTENLTNIDIVRFEDDCSTLTDWTNGSTGTSIVSAGSGQFEFDTKGSAVGNTYSLISRTDIISPPDTFIIEIRIFFDYIGTSANTDYFDLIYSSSSWRFRVRFGYDDGMFIYHTGAATTEVGTNILDLDGWYTWKFVVDKTDPANAMCTVLKDDVQQGDATSCNYKDAFTDGDGYFSLTQRGNTTDNMLTYVDYIKITETDAFGTAEDLIYVSDTSFKIVGNSVTISVDDNLICDCGVDGTVNAIVESMDLVGETISEHLSGSSIEGWTDSSTGNASVYVLSEPVFAWGINDTGQLGDNTTTSRSNPKLTLIENINFTKFVASGNHAVGISNIGRIYVWGYNGWRQLGLGDATARYVPTSLSSTISWKAIGCGNSYTVGINGANGLAYGWGENSYGQLGTGDRTQRSIPAFVSSAISWKTISASNSSHTIGIDGSNGLAYAWGENTYGKLGTGNRTSYSVPTSVSSTISWREIVCGTGCTVGIDGSNGLAYAWGENTYGNLGTGNTTSYSVPRSVSSAISWKQIACAGYFMIGIDGSNGLAYGWGYNGYGQLGDNSRTTRSIPTSVSSTISWREIVCGTDNTIGIDGATGNIYVWGYNNYGQLGLGNRTNYSVPTLLSTNLSVRTIAAGYNSTIIAIDNDFIKFDTSSTAGSHSILSKEIIPPSENFSIEFDLVCDDIGIRGWPGPDQFELSYSTTTWKIIANIGCQRTATRAFEIIKASTPTYEEIGSSLPVPGYLQHWKIDISKPSTVANTTAAIYLNDVLQETVAGANYAGTGFTYGLLTLKQFGTSASRVSLVSDVIVTKHDNTRTIVEVLGNDGDITSNITEVKNVVALYNPEEIAASTTSLGYFYNTGNLLKGWTDNDWRNGVSGAGLTFNSKESTPVMVMVPNGDFSASITCATTGNSIFENWTQEKSYGVTTGKMSLSGNDCKLEVTTTGNPSVYQYAGSVDPDQNNFYGKTYTLSAVVWASEANSVYISLNGTKKYHSGSRAYESLSITSSGANPRVGMGVTGAVVCPYSTAAGNYGLFSSFYLTDLSTSWASRSRTIFAPPDWFDFEVTTTIPNIEVECGTPGAVANNNHGELIYGGSGWQLKVLLGTDGVYVANSSGYTNIGDLIELDAVQSWKFSVDKPRGGNYAYVDVWQSPAVGEDMVYIGRYSCNSRTSPGNGILKYTQYGYSIDNSTSVVSNWKVTEKTYDPYPGILNNDFENWTSPSSNLATHWTLSGPGTLASDTGTKKVGTYSAKLTNSTNFNTYVYQDIESLDGHNIAYYRGKTITVGAWINTDVALNATIIVDDGIVTTLAAHHTGVAGWEFIYCTKTISLMATYIRISCNILKIGSAYFDSVKMIEGTATADVNGVFTSDIIINGALDTAFTGTAPDGWTLWQGGTGGYSVYDDSATKIVGSSVIGTTIYQNINVIPYRGKYITTNCKGWSENTVTNAVYMSIQVDNFPSESDYVTLIGSTDTLEIVTYIPKTAINLKVELNVASIADDAAWFWDCTMVAEDGVTADIPNTDTYALQKVGEYDFIWDHLYHEIGVDSATYGIVPRLTMLEATQAIIDINKAQSEQIYDNYLRFTDWGDGLDIGTTETEKLPILDNTDEDTTNDVTYIDQTTFSCVGDWTESFIVSSGILMDCGTDGMKAGNVYTATYYPPVTVDETIIKIVPDLSNPLITDSFQAVFDDNKTLLLPIVNLLLFDVFADVENWTDESIAPASVVATPTDKLLMNTGNGGEYAWLGRTIATPPDRFIITIKAYFHSLALMDNYDCFEIGYATDSWIFRACWSEKGLFLWNSGGVGNWIEVGTEIVKCNAEAQWQTFKFAVDKRAGEELATVKVYKDDGDGLDYIGTYDCNYMSQNEYENGYTYLYQPGHGNKNLSTTVDFVQIVEVISDITLIDDITFYTEGDQTSIISAGMDLSCNCGIDGVKDSFCNVITYDETTDLTTVGVVINYFLTENLERVYFGDTEWTVDDGLEYVDELTFKISGDQTALLPAGTTTVNCDCGDIDGTITMSVYTSTYTYSYSANGYTIVNFINSDDTSGLPITSNLQKVYIQPLVDVILYERCWPDNLTSWTEVPSAGNGTITEYTNSIISNSNFETWSGSTTCVDWIGTPTQESAIKYSGTYSAKLTVTASDGIYRDITTLDGHDMAYWRGKNVKFNIWGYASAADRLYAFVQTKDGSYGSDYHTGDSTWQHLTVTYTIPNDATYLQIGVWDDGGSSTTWYIDSITFQVETESINGGVSNDIFGQYKFDTGIYTGSQNVVGLTRVLETPPDIFTIELKVRFDLIGTSSDDAFRMWYCNNTWQFCTEVTSAGMYIYNNDGQIEVGDGIVKCNDESEWQTYKFIVDKSESEDKATVEVQLYTGTDFYSYGTFSCNSTAPSGADGEFGIVQYGITANMVSTIGHIKISAPPATEDTTVTEYIPNAYPETGTPDILNELCDSFTNWTNDDSGTSTTAIVSAGHYQFNTGATPNGTNHAFIYRYVGEDLENPGTYIIPDNFVFEIKALFELLGAVDDIDCLDVWYGTDTWRFRFKVDTNSLYVYSAGGIIVKILDNLIATGSIAIWHILKFVVDRSNGDSEAIVHIFANVDDSENLIYLGDADCNYEGTAWDDGQVGIALYGTTIQNLIVDMDHIKISTL